jgi:hypothetical protein
MTIRWSTVIQAKNGNRWHFFSQQAWKEAQGSYEQGEVPMSDGDYLKACQELEPNAILRIMPLVNGQAFPMCHAGTVVDEVA